MEDKKKFLKICIYISSILVLFLMIFSFLGIIKRVGYLSEFKFDLENINNTLELNGINIEETKNIFTIDNVLDNDALANYIFTNESITNYNYGFRLKYYNKFFRNSDLYNVYIDVNEIINDNDFIKEIKISEKGSPFGILVSDKKLDYNEKIDNINYSLLLKSRLIKYVILFYFITLLIIYYYKFIFNFFTKIDKYYIFIAFIGIILFIFQFWLCFPGYYNYPDAFTIVTEAINNVYKNWHPFIIGLTLHILYKIFGYHTFYIFFINLFLWYVGLSLIIISLYYKFKNKLVIFLFALSFLANIFFANITHLKDITATLFFFFSISILIFQMLVDVKNKIFNIILNVIMYISLIFALLWRHNFIVTIYPIFIVIVYRHLKNINNKKHFLLKFCSIMLIIAFTLIAIVKISPKFVSHINEKSYYPASVIILFHIAACSVPANDGSLIPEEWYLENKTFEDLKTLYNKNNIISDFLILYDDKVFKFLTYEEKPKLQSVLLKYIMKYPLNYIKHILNYSIEFITNTYIFIPVDQNSIQNYGYGITDTYKKVFNNDVGIKLSPIKYSIYSFLYINKIYLTAFYFIILSIILFFLTGYIWLFKSNSMDDFLLLSFSLAFSSAATVFIVCLFTPDPVYRYIHPIIIISILSLILFILHKLNVFKISIDKN